MKRQPSISLLSRTLLTFCMLLLAADVVVAQQASGGTLPVGQDLTYQRGTARAKEEVLEFPYTHRNSDRKCWAHVVRDGKGSRLICKEAEAGGKKDKDGRLKTQEFPADHRFQKTLDLIRQDAFYNARKDLMKQKSIDKSGWTVTGNGSAVYNLFYKDSKRRTFALLAVQQEGREKLTGPPVAVVFERTRRGVTVSQLNMGGTSSPPKIITPQTDGALFKVFSHLEKRNGF